MTFGTCDGTLVIHDSGFVSPIKSANRTHECEESLEVTIMSSAFSIVRPFLILVSPLAAIGAGCQSRSLRSASTPTHEHSIE